MGHGGTLDPLATGVLIVGLGRGTKHLQKYLGCSKTYETVVLFGKSTDTYDVEGKIVGEDDFRHVTRELVENQLAQFRGPIRQMPPVYSALKVNGKKALEYAREGKVLPRALESREMQVDECTLLEWLDGGEHEYRWPAGGVSETDRRAFLDSSNTAGQTTAPESESLHTVNKETAPSFETVPCAAPAARIRLTVSSGFYVRSFCHDLGIACSSYGVMAALLRSCQATFTVADPAPWGHSTALTYTDISAGESVWGPKISLQLSKWMEENPKPEGHVNGRSPATKEKMKKEKALRPKQRFRGGWVAETKRGRKKQQSKEGQETCSGREGRENSHRDHGAKVDEEANR
jgi:tRNA pseudouridine55 synthase